MDLLNIIYYIPHKQMLQAKQIGKCIVDSSNQFGIRSSKRTNPIHELISKIIIEENPGLTCKIEDKLNISTGSFKVDISASRDGIVKLLVSVKASLNNIKQNLTNNENVKGGELLKMVNAYPKAKIVFLDFIPSECRYYLENGETKNIEKFSPEKIFKENLELMEVLSPRGVPLCDGIFTIITNNKYPDTRGNLEFIGITDCSDMDKFIKLVKEL
jgi:hypothetical protein